MLSLVVKASGLQASTSLINMLGIGGSPPTDGGSHQPDVFCWIKCCQALDLAAHPWVGGLKGRDWRNWQIYRFGDFWTEMDVEQSIQICKKTIKDPSCPMKKSKCSGSMWGIMRLTLCFGVIGTKMFVGSWSTFATLPPLPLGSCWGECHNQLPKKDGHCSHMSWANLIALNKISSAQVIIRWKKWRDFKVQTGVVLTRLISFIGSSCLDFIHKRWSIKNAGVHLRINAKHFRTWAKQIPQIWKWTVLHTLNCLEK